MTVQKTFWYKKLSALCGLTRAWTEKWLIWVVLVFLQIPHFFQICFEWIQRWAVYHILREIASSLLQSSFLRVHVSQPYKVTLHTRLFTRRFLREILMLVLSSSSRRLRNACLPMAILALTSFALRPSLFNMLPRYLYRLTSSSCFPFKRMFNSSLFDLDIFITLVFFSFILIPSLFNGDYITSIILLE